MNTQQPKISCIVSTYNKAKQLTKAVNSILKQSERDFELLIIDDNSNDRTKRICKKLMKQDKRIRYFKLNENHGHDGYPKNYGIKQAKGQYITFLDDDDVYRQDALKVLYNFIKQTKVDLIYGDYLIHNKGKAKPGWSLDFQASLLQKMNYIAMSVVMVKRKALLKVGGFNENIHILKDWNLWLRLHKAGYQICHIPIIITEVYTGDQSISDKYKLIVQHNEDGSYYSTEFNPADCKIYADKTCLGTQRLLRVAIFTMTKDRKFYSQKMLESMVKTNNYPYDWVVVDNGSKDGSIEWLTDWAKKNKVPYEFVNKN